MTYSIIGRDRNSGEIGCAVQSKFPGVASVALHGRANIGVVTTQGFADPRAAQRLLDLMALGATAGEALDIVLRGLHGVTERQFGVMAMQGHGAGHSGSAMAGWNGVSGCENGNECLACGNALTNEGVLLAMVRAFEAGSGQPLAERLIAALQEGRDAGGELRGQQSAGVLVLRKGGGYGGLSDRLVDITVYDHDEPIDELARCYQLHRMSYFPSDPDKLVRIEGETAQFLRDLLSGKGYPLSGEEEWQQADTDALARFLGEANYDNRIHHDGTIDGEVLADLKDKFR